MRVAELASETDLDGWRKAARAFRLADVRPEIVGFRIAGSPTQDGLFDTVPEDPRSGEPGTEFLVPKAFMDVAKAVILHRSVDRFGLLYRILWRLRDEPDLMQVLSDPDVADALDRARNVSRASHKMKAFVRFRFIDDPADETAVAWFEPAHRVLERTAPFFVNRFTAMRWSILTPDGSAFWDGKALAFGPPASADDAPRDDEVETFWKTYYASTFNPARLKTRTMQGEMPKRYWKNLPEAALIPDLVAASRLRTDAMVTTPPSEPNARLARETARHTRDLSLQDGVPPTSLEDLHLGIQTCRRCPLWRDATQGVCGEGPTSASLMIVGEQPGDHEDLAGRPFVGPAGRMLDAALSEVGIDRGDVFITNAVKHFKHEPRGKRRLHRTPTAGEVTACRWWLDHERQLVKPRVILALGATAALIVLDRKVAVTRERGQPILMPDGAETIVTVHPAYVLRLPDEADRRSERAAFIRDLEAVRKQL